MKPYLRFLILGALFLLQPSCTDERRPLANYPSTISDDQLPNNLVYIQDVKFQGKDLNVWNMQLRGTSLFVTGTPFGFMRWEIGADPEQPQITFAVSDQIDRLYQRWVAPWYASGGLAIWQNFGLLSGSVGASIIDMNETHAPFEARRYPAFDPNSDNVIKDEAFVWTAAVAHPQLPYVYGFRSQDYVLTYQINGQDLQLIAKNAYGSQPNQSVCCVTSATIFQNKVFVSFRSKLVFFDIGANGALTNPREFAGLNPTFITATGNYLYVANNPVASSYLPTQTPPGIFVFNSAGQNVNFLAATPRVFAVSPDDTYVYMVGPNYVNDTAIRIFRIQEGGATLPVGGTSNLGGALGKY